MIIWYLGSDSGLWLAGRYSTQLEEAILQGLLSIVPAQPGANPKELTTSQYKTVNVKITKSNLFL